MAGNATEDSDARIADLLRQGAPAERDAMFRLGVIERRERQRFQRRSLMLLAAAIALGALFWLSFSLGMDLFATAAVSGLCAALIASYAVSAPAVVQLVRRLRAERGVRGKG